MEKLLFTFRDWLHLAWWSLRNPAQSVLKDGIVLARAVLAYRVNELLALSAIVFFLRLL